MGFLDKGFTETPIDFILLHNDNYTFKVLREKMNSLKQWIIFRKNFFKEIESNNTMIQEEMKRDNAVLLEKLSVGNRILTVITAIEISIIIAIIMSFISKFFIG